MYVSQIWSVYFKPIYVGMQVITLDFKANISARFISKSLAKVFKEAVQCVHITIICLLRSILVVYLVTF